VLVVAPGRQGFGEQVPGPTLIPPAPLHLAAAKAGVVPAPVELTG